MNIFTLVMKEKKVFIPKFLRVIVVQHCWTELKGGQKKNSAFIREKHHCCAAGRVSQRQL